MTAALPSLSRSAMSTGACRDALRAAAVAGSAWVVEDALDPALVARALAAAERFFATPLAERSELDAEPNGGVRGYRALPQREGDLKEWFFATFGVREDPALDSPIPGVNLWPRSVPELQPALADCARAMHAVGHAALAALADAAGVPRDAWSCLTGGGLRVLRYPCAEERRVPEQLGANPHTDMTPFAVIAADAPGLECDVEGFRPVPSISGSVACLPGELLERWTGDGVRAVSHRVTLGERARISLCYFMLPELSAPIAPVRTSLDRPYRAYAPTTFGEYMLMHAAAVRARG